MEDQQLADAFASLDAVPSDDRDAAELPHGDDVGLALLPLKRDHRNGRTACCREADPAWSFFEGGGPLELRRCDG
jgi:hypothetical protein